MQRALSSILWAVCCATIGVGAFFAASLEMHRDIVVEEIHSALPPAAVQEFAWFCIADTKRRVIGGPWFDLEEATAECSRIGKDALIDVSLIKRKGTVTETPVYRVKGASSIQISSAAAQAISLLTGGVPTGVPAGTPGLEPEEPPPDPPAPNSAAPMWAHLPDQSIVVGLAWSINLAAYLSDAEGNTLTVAIEDDDGCDWLSLDDFVLNGTPDEDEVCTVVLSATDGGTSILYPRILTSELATSYPLPPHTEEVTYQYDFTPAAGLAVDSVCGFGGTIASGLPSSSGSAAFNETGFAVRFNPGGVVDARNNAMYEAEGSYPYKVGAVTRITSKINRPAGTFDATANATPDTPENAVQIADSYAPRGGAVPDATRFFTCLDAMNRSGLATTSVVSNLQIIQPMIARIRIVAYTPDITPPPAPSAPTVSGFTTTSITLAFPAGVADHKDWDLHWRAPPGTGNYQVIAPGTTAASYTHTGLGQNTAHEYMLRERDTSDNVSPDGAAVSQTTAAIDFLSRIECQDVSHPEGNSGTTNRSSTCTLSSALSFAFRCTVSFINGTALTPGDYVPVSTSITFNAGATSATVTAGYVGDYTQEPTETFKGRLSDCGPI